jgi:serine/threonine protein kinase
MTLQQPPPTLDNYEDEKSGAATISGTEWASKSSGFKKFLKQCMKRIPTDRATVAQLSTSKFVTIGKKNSATLNNAQVTFATEICNAIPPIHELSASKDSKDADGKKDLKNTTPEWDFQDMNDDDDDDFGAAFASAGISGE